MGFSITKQHLYQKKAGIHKSWGKAWGTGGYRGRDRCHPQNTRFLYGIPKISVLKFTLDINDYIMYWIHDTWSIPYVHMTTDFDWPYNVIYSVCWNQYVRVSENIHRTTETQKGISFLVKKFFINLEVFKYIHNVSLLTVY